MTPTEVRRRLLLRQELALLDVREEKPFSDGHPLFAANLPLSRLESEAYARLPRRSAPIVVYDSGEGIAERAVSILSSLGFSNCHQLEGGLDAWCANGFELFRDVNSYCKAFGELVETRRNTPSLPAGDVKRLMDRGEDLVILDARTFDEYQTMAIPGGISTPGAELVLRARTTAPSAKTTIIVNCAGRTRSLIGAQSLINARIPNKVFALRNGTIGWTLEGFDLAFGSDRRSGDAPRSIADEALVAARAVSYAAGARRIDWQDLEVLSAHAERSVYKFDVRTRGEHQINHPPGFVWAEGGQLVQETDVYAPIRGARIVLCDDVGPRAHMTASWLAQMAWDVYVLEGEWPERQPGQEVQPRPHPPDTAMIEPAKLAQLLEEQSVTLIDLASSRVFRRQRIPGATFAIRSRLLMMLSTLPTQVPLVLTSPDGSLAQWTAVEAAEAFAGSVLVLKGGTQGWLKAGLPLAKEGVEVDADDAYQRPYVSASSSRLAMQAYLDWEAGLVAQLEKDATHGFFVI